MRLVGDVNFLFVFLVNSVANYLLTGNNCAYYHMTESSLLPATALSL